MSLSRFSSYRFLTNWTTPMGQDSTKISWTVMSNNAMKVFCALSQLSVGRINNVTTFFTVLTYRRIPWQTQWYETSNIWYLASASGQRQQKLIPLCPFLRLVWSWTIKGKQYLSQCPLSKWNISMLDMCNTLLQNSFGSFLFSPLEYLQWSTTYMI